MNPSNRALTDEQVREARALVWRKGVSQTAAAQRFGMKKQSGSFWRMLHGYAYKNVGGPTGRGQND